MDTRNDIHIIIHDSDELEKETYMNKRIKKIIASCVAGLTLIICSVGSNVIILHAAQTTTTILNSYYDFGSDGDYIISGTTSNVSTTSTLGSFSITGNTSQIDSENGFKRFEVKSDVVSFDYSIGSQYITDDEYRWHIINDKAKEFDGGKLESNIGKGTIIVQTSLTGEKWITEAIYYDILGDKSAYSSDIYTSKILQQINGCYFRIIVLYEVQKRIDDASYGPISVAKYEEKRCAEVYRFYLIDSAENESYATRPDTEPRMELGETINTGKDNGYSGNIAIDNNDPHFGWSIGQFYVNGYTRSTIDSNDNTTVFIKDLGDRVTLWFNLKEDIYDMEKNNNHIYVNEDTNGYDQYFQISERNFKHGTLIIRYTDYEGVKHAPIIYTDYLAACATTGADTKVELFEEGDYEVALNYELVKDELIDSYSDYRIFFKFKIRNGNCMAYPFDVTTNDELGDGAITPNGFRLDLAMSRYLTIDIVRYSLKLEDGIYVQDPRENTVAKDGDTYTQPGVYQFTVKNLYTNAEDTSKIIYVGTDPIYKALARGLFSLDEINSMLAAGGILEMDGTITLPVEAEDENVADEAPDDIEPAVDDSTISEENTQLEIPADISEVIEESSNESEVLDEQDKSNVYIGWIIMGIIVAAAGVFLIINYQKKNNNRDMEDKA